jgi:radical SAM superfamily enzyme YgiQ (UPF0313 family)
VGDQGDEAVRPVTGHDNATGRGGIPAYPQHPTRHRDHEDAVRRELVLELSGHRVGHRRDEDAVERRLVGSAQPRRVGRADPRPRHPGPRDVRRPLLHQVGHELQAEHGPGGADELREDRGGPAGSGADVEHAVPRAHVEQLEHRGDGTRLAVGGAERTVRWALMYPDAYEVGLPNQGVMILYEVLNERPDALAERTYAVWPDLEALLREHGVPQVTVDGHRAVRDFDLFGISFSTELGYTNFLTALDLAGIPLHSRDRTDADPIVVTGGHASFNPEPIADFTDVVVIGDGEQAVLELTDLVAAWKVEGRPGGREELLLRIARSGVAYVPACYEVDYFPDGRIRRVAPRTGLTGIPWRVAKHTVTDLDAWPYPKAPLVPLAETVHERMSVEIFRGCTRGCRFCQAGMITRPVRERSITGIGEMVERGLAATGFEEVGLLSLSSADHSEIAAVTKGLADRYEGSQTGLSLPSTRVDAFNIDLANELSRGGRRSGLTFAPEGGSERLRKVINKQVSEQDLVDTVAAAFAQAGVRSSSTSCAGYPPRPTRTSYRSPRSPRASSRPVARSAVAGTSGAPCPSAGSCPSRTRRSSGRVS